MNESKPPGHYKWLPQLENSFSKASEEAMDEKKKLVTDDGALLCDPEIEKSGWAKCSQKYLMYSEPVLFLAGLAVNAYVQLNQQYLYYRVEASKDFPSWIQDELDSDESDDSGTGCVSSGSNSTDIIYNIKAEITAESAYFSSIVLLFRGIPPLFLAIIYCSYTNSIGRRFGLILPTVGGLLNMVVYLIVEYLQAPLEWLYLGNLIEGLSGGHNTLLGCGFAYLYDTTQGRILSFRYTLYQSVFYLSTAVASLILGYIIDGMGFLAAIWSLVIAYGAALLYEIFILPESLPMRYRKPFSLKQVSQNLLNGFAVFFRRRPNPLEQYSLILILVITFIVSIVSTGFFNLLTLYMEGVPFCLNSVQIGIVLAVMSALSVIVPPIEIKLWGLCFQEEFFSFLALCIASSACLVGAFASNLTGLYITVVLLSMGTCVIPLCRALMSKISGPEEQGCIQAAVSSLAGVGELISETVLVAIYAATESLYYGSVFIIVAALQGLCIIPSLFVWHWQRRSMHQETAQLNGKS